MTNNGFETNGLFACIDLGLPAIDADSGTNTGNACNSSGKDRHRFYWYSFGIPASSTINGIEVRLDAAVAGDATGDDPRMCVELSWDGGSSWTAHKVTANLTGTIASFTLGRDLRYLGPLMDGKQC